MSLILRFLLGAFFFFCQASGKGMDAWGDLRGIDHRHTYGRNVYGPALSGYDPSGESGGLNLHGYCHNDPINYWDYLGLQSELTDEERTAQLTLNGNLVSQLLGMGSGNAAYATRHEYRARLNELADFPRWNPLGWTYRDIILGDYRKEYEEADAVLLQSNADMKKRLRYVKVMSEGTRQQKALYQVEYLLRGAVLGVETGLILVPEVSPVGGVLRRQATKMLVKEGASASLRPLGPKVRMAEVADSLVGRGALRLPNPHAGIQEASAYLRAQGVSRADRVQILQSFNLQNMTVRQAGSPEFGLRFFSDASCPAGPYLFETFPALRSSLAIKPHWSTMSGFRQFQVRPGATILEGTAAPQGPYLPGGQTQKYILNWRSNLQDP